MKKTLVLTLISMAAAATVSAEVLTPAQALTRALGEAPAGIHKIAVKDKTSIQPALTIGSDSEPEIYIFNPSDKSMLIIAAESDVPALIGYSEEGTFDPSNIPPGLNAMLESYAFEIQHVRAGLARAATGGRADYAPILPLCQTMWNQDRPYNSACPKLGSTYSVTGCVATAMAQVLKVLQWPDQCTGGKETYEWQSGGKNLSLNFDQINLEWDKMENIYTSTAITPSSKTVATLMQAIGYASHMDYSPEASSATSLDLAIGLFNHFDYDCTLRYEKHEWYTQAEWETMLYEELAAGIPVYYDGTTSNRSGHAFVVDGYSGDGYFHLNWGWGGISNGYYRLTALDPTAQGIGGSSSGYNFYQGMIVGLRKGATTPNEERPLTFECINTFGIENSSVSKGKEAVFTGGFYNAAPIPVSNIAFGVKFVNEATGEEHMLRSDHIYSEDVYPEYGLSSYGVTIPTDLPDGTYTVYPTVYCQSTNETYNIKTHIGGYGILIATVDGSKVTFSEPARAELQSSDLNLTSKVYPGTTFSVSATISNPSSLPYNGFIFPVIFSSTTGMGIKAFDDVAIEVAAGQSTEINLLCDLESSFSTGDYHFCIADDEGNQTGPAIPITVEPRPAAGVLKFNRAKVLDTAQNNLTVQMTLSCTSGYYCDAIYAVIISRDGSGEIIDYFNSEQIRISENETQTITFTGNCPNGEPGTSYSIAPFYVNADDEIVPMNNASYVVFKLSDGIYGVTDNIDEISDSDSAAPAEWFDLQGRKIASPSKSSISIMRRKDKITKVRL